jgi:phenylacetate-CoA ligase
LGVKIIISTGEALRVNERIWLEKELGASVFNTYGAADPSVWLASECQAQQGLHIFPYTAYIETVNDKLVVTPFANSATVLVRYVLGDKIKLDYQKCACGRTLPRIKTIEREAKLLVIGNKKIKPAVVLPKVLAGFKQTTSFFNFIYEPDKKSVKIIIEVDKDVLATNKKRTLVAAIKKALLAQSSELLNLEKGKQIKIKISLVSIGTLPRRAAKLVNQIRVKN